MVKSQYTNKIIAYEESRLNVQIIKVFKTSQQY